MWGASYYPQIAQSNLLPNNTYYMFLIGPPTFPEVWWWLVHMPLPLLAKGWTSPWSLMEIQTYLHSLNQMAAIESHPCIQNLGTRFLEKPFSQRWTKMFHYKLDANISFRILGLCTWTPFTILAQALTTLFQIKELGASLWSSASTMQGWVAICNACVDYTLLNNVKINIASWNLLVQKHVAPIS